jgi:hypothetical protein
MTDNIRSMNDDYSSAGPLTPVQTQQLLRAHYGDAVPDRQEVV